jgi:peroxiredoxin
MKLTVFVLGAVLLAALPIEPGDGTTPPSSTPAAGNSAQALRPSAPEPPSAELEIGDRVPDFSYQTSDYTTVGVKQLLAQGNLLLVFGASDAVLRSLEQEREALLDLGVVPVAVMDSRSSAVWATGRRLGLHYSLVPDPLRVISGQFNTVDDHRRPLPSWFVLDRLGRVRALRRNELPIRGYPRLVATVLAVPTRDVSVPVRSR